MNRPPIIGAGDGYADPLALGMAMLAANSMNRLKLTEEEKAQNRAYLKAQQEERRRRAWIISGECPTCESKLIRGKKDKKNDYKRSWKCSKCEEMHIL